MSKNEAPGEDGKARDILLLAFNLLPKSTTALYSYNGCLRTACFIRIWKRARIIPRFKPGKETSDDISKYHPISLINTAAKVLEKVLINRIMHNMYSNKLMSKTNMDSHHKLIQLARKDFVQDSLKDGQYGALISLNV
jgi:hypothetical protein